eukprot:TRINITY_DN1200_c0_g2_i1.p1 TRINITY_DN1200_c0_g2~~TRINITY_DN1200_c0_g2_i1.p1  ORF type:complete len:267 (+),score=54.71 TRINITY_DN1200_c0_g2_i1:65-865(+)
MCIRDRRRVHGISRKALTRYQMLFRHLFYCKFIERQLSNTWLLHQSTKELNLQRSSLFSCALTQRMLHFSKNLIYNMTYEVLEQKWLKLENSLKTVSKFDDLITLHNSFLDECLKESLLLDQNLLKLITKLNSTCMVFSKYMQSFVRKNIGYASSILLMNDRDAIVDEKKPSTNFLEMRKKKVEEETAAKQTLLQDRSHIREIQKYEKTFNTSMKDFLTLMNQLFNKYDTHLLNLLTRLDYDGFYNNYLWNSVSLNVLKTNPNSFM